MHTDIDVTFDFRRDTPEGEDPDRYSKTLRRYHKSLWSKCLPCGSFFGLDDTIPGHYLYHQSGVGDFSLSSDAVIPTFKWNEQIQSLIPACELECIRRHYANGTSPLSDVLARYSNFFELFGSFRCYVEFFFLQDLVSTDFSLVKISAPFDDFSGSPIPKSVSEYKAYENDAREFVEARNQRILSSGDGGGVGR